MADETDCNAAVEELAALLYWKIEHFDPGDDPEFVEWLELEDTQRELWRQGVMYLLRHGSVIARCSSYTGL